MKKRLWNVRRTYLEQPDARSRWDRSYQSLIQWSGEGLKGQTSSPQLTQENSHEHRAVRSGVNESAKHKHKQSNNRCICCVSTCSSRDGSGKRSTFFAMM